MYVPDELLVIAIVPVTGLVSTLYVSASLSTSYADSVPLQSVSTLLVTVPADATGASLTAVTVIETFAGSSHVSSLAVTVNESLPL